MSRPLDIEVGDIYGILKVLRSPEKIEGKKEQYCWCGCIKCGVKNMLKLVP